MMSLEGTVNPELVRLLAAYNATEGKPLSTGRRVLAGFPEDIKRQIMKELHDAVWWESRDAGFSSIRNLRYAVTGRFARDW